MELTSLPDFLFSIFQSYPYPTLLNDTATSKYDLSPLIPYCLKIPLEIHTDVSFTIPIGFSLSRQAVTSTSMDSNRKCFPKAHALNVCSPTVSSILGSCGTLRKWGLLSKVGHEGRILPHSPSSLVHHHVNSHHLNNPATRN